jgi:hypothetical protein
VDPRPDASTAQVSSRRKWDGVAALIAAFIGVLALLVSGYTAYLQRQQVRAQVWPYLISANYDPEFAIKVLNKGVGPAIIRSVRIWVDDKPQHDWRQALAALDVPVAELRTSTVSHNVISANEMLAMIVFPDETAYRRFRNAARNRIAQEICYCSTLGECWVYSDRTPGAKATQAAVDECPGVPDTDAFDD